MPGCQQGVFLSKDWKFCIARVVMRVEAHGPHITLKYLAFF